MPDVLTRLAYARRVATGESYQTAREALVRDRGAGALPAATGAQALLESMALRCLGIGEEFWAHPMGIASVRPAPDRVTVELDAFTSSPYYPGRFYGRAEHAGRCLLPHAQHGDMHGMVGLRIVELRGLDLHVTLVGTASRMILRGARGAGWRGQLRLYQQSTSASGFEALYQEPHLTEAEVEHLEYYPEESERDRELAWLGSGLLRRIGLFRSATAAFAVRPWVDEFDEWNVELSYPFTTTMDHAPLLAGLTDRRLGLPLRVRSTTCHCAEPRSATDQRRRVCRIELVHRDELPGVLQLRFTSEPAGWDASGPRQRLASAGADPRWLDRVLPAVAGGR